MMEKRQCNRPNERHGPHIWYDAWADMSYDCRGARGVEIATREPTADADYRAEVVEEAPNERGDRTTAYPASGLTPEQLEKVAYHVHMLFDSSVTPHVGELGTVVTIDYDEGSFAINCGPEMLINPYKIAGLG